MREAPDLDITQFASTSTADRVCYLSSCASGFEAGRYGRPGLRVNSTQSEWMGSPDPAA
jgi:hypothetical protein